jgi:hypothetical protein
MFVLHFRNFVPPHRRYAGIALRDVGSSAD